MLQLDLVLNSETGGDLSDFITNGEWYLLGKLTIFVVFFCSCLEKSSGPFDGRYEPFGSLRRLKKTILFHLLRKIIGHKKQLMRQSVPS